ncbi:conserved hypothetical protein [Coccidioides posadasii str. Silveira]|uniref:Uncharacterized protein n=1 Tax=Coccidioides posadasii (strain RMSCC 757 / Silveira) TaxID=443226 RepID=E9D762_COCPS|nr:conserved hypothetical protein [Coccidioides posadasii str. Silveira]
MASRPSPQNPQKQLTQRKTSNHPPVQNNFHWGLYFHRHPDTGGTKYHIKQQGSGWIADHGPTAGVFKSFLLVGLFRIADVPAGWEGHLDHTIRTYDSQLNTPGVTCRVWVLWVLALLQKPINGQIILKCDNLAALENEVKSWGNANAMGAANNVQPRPVAASTLCGL